jgi:hypothetical protein
LQLSPEEVIVSEKDLILPGFNEIDWELGLGDVGVGF